MAPQRTVVSIIIAAYMVILGLLTFCGSLALVGLGGLAGSLGSIGSVASSADAQAAVAQAQSASGLLVVLGVILLIIGVAYLVTGIGLFIVRSWAYNAAIIINVLYVVVSIVSSLAQGTFQISSLLFPILSLVMVVLLLTDGGTKKAFGRS